MSHTFHDPVVQNVSEERREYEQLEFGRHLIEHRDRVAVLVRSWVETETRFPIPIYDQLIERVRCLDSATRADIASISLLMADQVVAGMLTTFDGGDEMKSGDKVKNYAIVAQTREPNSDEIIAQVDINRGQPFIAIWDRYKRWLSRFSTTELRPSSGSSRIG